MNIDWVFLDLETTGIDHLHDKVIEIAMIICRHDGTRETFETLINPGVPIPQYITYLTGINDAMVEEAPAPEEVADKIRTLLEGKLIVAHNAPFDLKFLQTILGDPLPNKWIDTLELVKILFSGLPSYSLRYLVRNFSLDSQPTHRASADTEALEKLFFYLQKQVEALSLQEIQNIYYFLQDEEKGLSLFFAEILREKIRTYDFHQPIIAQEFNNGIARGIKRSSDKETYEWSLEELSKMFMPGGAIAQGLQTYQKRSEQIKMMKTVAKAFNQERHLVVEAGTGVGKSLAYLVPALAWAVSKQEKVVVATHTIALQEQLLRSDIQFLHKQLPFTFKAVVLKGRNNYFCINKWRTSKNSTATLTWPEKVLMARLAHWIDTEKTGDRDTVSLRGWEAEIFAQLSSTRENCYGAQCPFIEECYYQKAREKAQKADLIIVNHSLLLSNVKIGEAILPTYNYLIVDEAHHLEEEGTKQFTATFSLRDFQKKINQILKKKESFRKPGLLYIWSNYKSLSKESLPDVKKLINSTEECSRIINQKIEEINRYLSTQQQTDTLRINEDTYQQKWWENLTLLFDNLQVHANDLVIYLAQLYNRLSEDCSEIKWENSLKDLRTFFGEIKEDLELVNRFFHTLEEEYVYWLELHPRKGDISLHMTPVNIAELFSQLLFSTKKTSILTSATLSVADNFNFLIDQLGLVPELVDTLKISSPFLYDEQSLLLIDNSLPEPTHIGEEAYNLALKEALYTILQATGGRTLVLFTSHKQLQKMYGELKGSLQEKGLEIYADGVSGHRTTLLDELKNNPAAIVFGANTFWEGIDLPGSALTSVVMIKLPFWPPHLPLVEARVEAMKKEGKDGFFHYSLPQAVLRFRQGYGRLIRTIDDWGVVVVLDNRLLKKRYGKVFLNSLPQQHYIAGNTARVVDCIRKWFKKQR